MMMLAGVSVNIILTSPAPHMLTTDCEDTPGPVRVLGLSPDQRPSDCRHYDPSPPGHRTTFLMHFIISFTD